MRKTYATTLPRSVTLILFLALFVTRLGAQCPGFSGSISGPAFVCTGWEQTYRAVMNPANGTYTYKWSTGQQDPAIKLAFPTANQIVPVSVTVTDAGGCTEVYTLNVTRIGYSMTFETTPACPGAEGTVKALVAPGVPDLPDPPVASLSFVWNTGVTLAAVASPNIGAITVESSIQTEQSGLYSAAFRLDTQVCLTGSTFLQMFDNPTPVIVGPPGVCPNAEATLSLDPAGPTYAAYAWNSNGGNDPTRTITTGGTYRVTVTDFNGCTGTDDLVVSTYPVPFPTLQGPQVLQCYQDSAFLNVQQTYSTYEWSTGETTKKITAYGPGFYSVTVTNSFGCTGEASRFLGQLSLATPTINASATKICPGDTVTLTVVTAHPYFAWSNGDSTQTIRVTTAGAYAVTVTSLSGCTAQTDKLITPLPGPQATLPGVAPLCAGDSTELAVSGGPFPGYAWSTGDTTANITAYGAGLYEVTVTNSSGCSKRLTTTVPAAPSVNATLAIQPYTCDNTLTIAAPPNLTSYAWSTGDTTASINISATGAYAVTATNSFGCSGTGAINAAIPAAPTVSITGPSAICAGSQATFGLSGTFLSFEWSTGDTATTITTGTAGAYSVTVADTYGCTATSAVNLSVGATIVPTVVEQPYQCNDQRTLDAGAGYTSYLWSTGATTPTVTVTTPGDYAVTVIDASGCTGTATVTATIPPTPKVSVTGNPSLCPGTPGQLEASAGFTLYQWSNGPLTATNDIPGPGAYTVTATDQYGCTATTTANVVALPTPVAQLDAPAGICPGAQATIEVLGGPFASYAWSGVASDSATALISGPGLYEVTLTNVQGCTATVSQQVNAFNAPTPVVAPLPYTCTGDLTIEVVGVYAGYSWSTGSTNSRITVTTSGDYQVTVTDANGCTAAVNTTVDVPVLPVVQVAGPLALCPGNSVELVATTGFASYLWSNGESGESITIDSSGAYGVTITDANGCTAEGSIAVDDFVAPVPALQGPAGVCPGATGVISAVDPAFTAFIWSTGDTTASVSGILPGTYSVTVTDLNGCTGSADIHIDSLAAPVVQPIALPYACDNQLTLEAAGAFATWAWSTGDTTATAIATANGSYAVTVTDANGCTGAQSIDVTIPANPVVGITGDTIICANLNTTLQASAGLVGYVWSTGDTTAAITAALAGDYTVTATDANGCTAEAVFTLGVLPIDPVEIDEFPNLCPGATSNLIATAGFASYVWSTGGLTDTITVGQAGVYSVTATAANGCTVSADYTVTMISLDPVAISGSPAICAGASTSLEASPGFVAYNWSNGTAQAALTVDQSGTYTVTVTDSNGCTASAEFSVAVLPVPQISLSGDTTLCPGGMTTVTATSGYLSYVWSNGTVGELNMVLAAGTYAVTVTDTTGCSSTGAITVTEVITNFAASGPAPLCAGLDIELQASGGDSYVWTGPDGFTSVEQNPVLTATTAAAGVYSVVIGDSATGCNNELTVTVDVLPAPVVTTDLPDTLCLGTGFVDPIGSPGGGTWSGPGIGANGQFNTLTAGPGTHVLSYTVSGSNGCVTTATDVIVVEQCVGTEEPVVDAAQWRVFPNPTSGLVHVENRGADLSRGVRADVFDARGQRVLGLELGDVAQGGVEALDLGALPAGVYMLQLRYDDRVWSGRVVVGN